jgi:transcriptional regulator with XRE-family HTH domain
MNRLSEKVTQLKNRMNLKNIELAKLSGIPNSTLADILRGKTERISLEAAKSLADTLGCTIDYLISEDEETPAWETSNDEELFLLKEEAELITIYRQLDARGKEAVMKLSRHELGYSADSGKEPIVHITDDVWKRYVGTVTAARGGLRLINEDDAKEIAKIKQAFLKE